MGWGGNKGSDESPGQNENITESSSEGKKARGMQRNVEKDS